MSHLIIQFRKAIDLSAAAKFDEGDVRAVSAALEFIVTTSAKHTISADTLSNELQQLGLPKGKYLNVKTYFVIIVC